MSMLLKHFKNLWWPPRQPLMKPIPAPSVQIRIQPANSEGRRIYDEPQCSDAVGLTTIKEDFLLVYFFLTDNNSLVITGTPGDKSFLRGRVESQTEYRHYVQVDTYVAVFPRLLSGYPAT